MNYKISDIKQLFYVSLSEKYSTGEVLTLFRQATQHINGFSMMYLHFNLNAEITDAHHQAYQLIVSRLAVGEPMQYILGFAWFMDLKIKVTPAVLIPRPETEELVNGFLERMKKGDPVVLDACSGSGCIALAVKYYLPEAVVIGIDVSEEAIGVSQNNASELNLNVDFQKGNILNDSFSALPQLDALISNPPYIPKREMRAMDDTVTRFEPHVALFVEDDDPLLFYRKLSSLGIRKLTPGGMLLVECHREYLPDIAGLFSGAGYQSVKQHIDLSGNPRWISALQP